MIRARDSKFGDLQLAMTANLGTLGVARKDERLLRRVKILQVGDPVLIKVVMAGVPCVFLQSDAQG
jgi:hypothetical protein